MNKIANTFKELLLLSLGKSIGSILHSACQCGPGTAHHHRSLTERVGTNSTERAWLLQRHRV